MLKVFRINEVANIQDGLLAAEVDVEIEKAIRDCVDRPTIDGERSVTLKISMKPAEHAGVANEVLMDFTVTSKTPALTSATFAMAIRKRTDKGRQVVEALFNDASRDDPRQGTLDDARSPNG